MCYVEFTTPPSYIGILLILMYYITVCLKLNVCNLCVLVMLPSLGYNRTLLLIKRSEDGGEPEAQSDFHKTSGFNFVTTFYSCGTVR